MPQHILRVQRLHNLNFLSTPSKGEGTLNPADYKIRLRLPIH
jgi:hypothetical protein